MSSSSSTRMIHMSYMHLGNIVAIYIFFGKKVRPNEGDSTDLKHLGVRRPEMGKKHNNQEKPKKVGRTRIRTGVVRIKTESDNHYTIQPKCFRM